MNVLFRCDASIKIGFGHLVRCFALAENLNKEHNCHIFFAMLKSKIGIEKAKKKYPVFENNQKDFDYEKWLLEIINRNKIDILIMDMRDGLKSKQLRIIKKNTNVKVVTIDDPEEKYVEADLAFYPPVPQLDRNDWKKFNGKLFKGWEYIILRKEFNIERINKINDIPNILVTMGGSDNDDMTGFVIELLKAIELAFTVTIIVGSGYTHLRRLKKSLKNVKYSYNLFQNPDNISQIMSKSRFAIISFGQTAYELASLKIPSLYICISKDHYVSATALQAVNAGRIIGIFKKIKPSLLNEKICHWLTDKKKIDYMAKKLQLLKISDINKISKIIIES
jgi:UDP-2,4-diacetamido-2,4,6-trideoxy-beta-L-altropyranose hydrolase